MSIEPFDSRAKAPPAKRWEKGCGDENVPVPAQPRSQGLSSYRPIERARRDPGTRWWRATLTIENMREASSVIRQLVELGFIEYRAVLQSTLAATVNNT